MARTTTEGRTIAGARTVAGNRFVNSPSNTSSLRFNGANSIATASTSASLNITSNFTATAWINPTTNGEGNGGRIFESGASRWAFIIGGGVFGNLNNGNNVTAGQVTFASWQFVTLTWNDTTDQASFFRNGALMGTVAQASNPIGTGFFFLGNRTASDRTWDGLLKNISIYNRVLTTAEMDDIYYRDIYGTSGLAALWKFNEGSGTVATDSSGNGNTANIANATYSTDVPFHMKQRTVVA